MFALDALRPGVIRCENSGAEIALEIWKIPTTSLGSLLGRIPSPLGLGKILLADGREVCGFLCEQHATVGKLEITGAGGWRNHLAVASSQP
jgi:allophanate hydrolase